MKKSIVFHLLVILFAFTSSVQAGTKEELVRLQNDVNTLRNQFREFEKTLLESNAGMKSLVEQLNDQAAKSNMLLEKIEAAIEAEASGESSRQDEILPEIQSLSNKIDEMATSISALARQISDLKVQAKTVNAPASPDLSSADVVFNQAWYDFVEGKYDLAIGGFNAYLKQFPSGNRAAEARSSIAEAYLYMKKYPEAIAAFTRIIDENADSDKVAVAMYKRGKSYLGNQDTTQAVEDFKTLIQRFPDAPEAALAKAELQDLGAAGKR